MGLRIQTNTAAETARRSLITTSRHLNKVYQRLSSGSRITAAADDAAGYALSENFKSQIQSISQAMRNTNDGISLVQVAEGGLNEISSMIIRLRELSIQAATDTVGDEERGFINLEFQSLLGEIDRIANVTSFNGNPLLNGQAPQDPLEFQVGIRNEEADRVQFEIGLNDASISTLGLEGLSVESSDEALLALDDLDTSLGAVNEIRARLGAMQNKLQSSVNNLGITREGLQQARSRISDSDIAEETSELVRLNILQSAGIAVLAQANTLPTQALKLL